MSSVVFRDDIDRTTPHMSKAIKTRAAVKEYRQAAVEESKSAAKKSKYALSSTGSKPVLGDISTSLCHRPCIYKSIVVCIKVSRGNKAKHKIGLVVGTQDGGYLNKVPLSRAPRLQSSLLMTCESPQETLDTCYIQVPQIPKWSDEVRSL